MDYDIAGKINVTEQRIHIGIYFVHIADIDSAVDPLNLAVRSCNICEIIIGTDKTSALKRSLLPAEPCRQRRPPNRHAVRSLYCRLIDCNNLTFHYGFNQIHAPVIHRTVIADLWLFIRILPKIILVNSILPIDYRFPKCHLNSDIE